MSIKRNGWVKIFILSVLLLVTLAVAAGTIAIKKLKENSPRIIAKMVEISAEGLFIKIELPQSERTAAMKEIRRFTQQIRDGQVSLQQGSQVITALGDQSFIGAIMIRGFEAGYINASALSPDERQAAHKTLTRFMHGSVEEKISSETYDEIMQMISDEQTDGIQKGQRTLKKSITTNELKTVLMKMEKAADDAGIENREYAFNMAEIIRDLIQKGMKAPTEATSFSGEGCIRVV